MFNCQNTVIADENVHDIKGHHGNLIPRSYYIFINMSCQGQGAHMSSRFSEVEIMHMNWQPYDSKH